VFGGTEMKKEFRYKCDNCGRRYKTEVERDSCPCDLIEKIDMEETNED
jgi:transposase-like protein